MFYQTQRAFRSGATQMDVMEGGRAAVELIAREMQEMTTLGATGGVCFIALEDQSYALQQLLPSGALSFRRIQDVKFVVRDNDDWKVIAYHVTSLDKAMTPTNVFVLSRFVASTNALDAVPGLLAAIGTTFVYPEADPMNTQFRRVIDGVVQFEVVPYSPAGVDTKAYTSPQWNDLAYPNTAALGNYFPVAFDLHLAVLETKALDRFKTKLGVNVSTARNYLANQAASVHLFQQRIPIRTTP